MPQQIKQDEYSEDEEQIEVLETVFVHKDE